MWMCIWSLSLKNFKNCGKVFQHLVHIKGLHSTFKKCACGTYMSF